MNDSRPFGKGRVIAVKALHENLWKTSILVEECLSFKPGQYIGLFQKEISLGYYSIASSLFELPYISIYTRSPLKIISQNEEVFISPPKGNMVFDQTDSEKQWVLCAGGTGITPFLSLVKTAPPTIYNRWRLYWSIRQNTDLALLESLPDSLADLVQIYHYDLSEDRDYYNELFKQLSQSSDKNVDYFIAGPMPFVEKTGAFLLRHHIHPRNILSDMKTFTL